MFKYLVVAALIACVAAAGDEAHAETKLLKSDVRHDGFDWALETDNGINARATGDEHGNIKGEYSYVSHDGVHVQVQYVADEHGYQPSSDLLPTPPPVPHEILKALEYLRAHPPKEEYHH